MQCVRREMKKETEVILFAMCATYNVINIKLFFLVCLIVMFSGFLAEQALFLLLLEYCGDI